MALNQLPSIPYRMHAPTPKATMKEMLKFIGMLGAPPVGCDVKGRRRSYVEISTQHAKGFCVTPAKQILAPRQTETVGSCDHFSDHFFPHFDHALVSFGTSSLGTV
jgi:hypothetical protein